VTKAQEGRGLFIGPPVWCGSILQGESDGSLAVVPEPTTRPGIWVVGAPQLKRIQNPLNLFCQATPPTPPTHHYLGGAIVGILSFPFSFSFSIALDSRATSIE